MTKPDDPTIDKLQDGSLRVHIAGPFTAASLRRTAFILDSIATDVEERACPNCAGHDHLPEEDPALASAAVLDDVRAVMLGRGRDFGFQNEIVNIVTMPGGTMGVSVSSKPDVDPIVAIAFGATGNRSDMRERLALPLGQQVPALSYVEITDFDREGVGHLIGAIKLAYPDLLP